MNAESGFLKCFYTLLIFFISTNDGLTQSAIDSLYNKLAAITNRKEIILLHNLLSEKLPTLKIDEAIIHCQNALKLAKSIPDDSLEAVCYKCLINAYYRKPYFEDSALYFVPLFEKTVSGKKYFELEGATLTGIGDVYLKQHNYPNAINYYQRALDAAEQTHKTEVIGGAKNALAEGYRKGASYDESRRYYNELVETGKKENITWMIFNGYRGLGICYDLEKDFENAAKYFRKALEVAVETKNKKRIAAASSLTGVALWHGKKYNEALEAIHPALAYYKTLDDEQIITPLQNLCFIYRDMGNLDSALYYGNLGIAEAKKRNQQFSLALLNGAMSDVYKQKEDYKNALQFTLEVIKFNDSSHTAERSKAVVELEAKYKTKEKQAEVNLLLKEKEVGELIRKQQLADLLNAQYEVEQEKKLSEINALDASNKKTQLENIKNTSRLKDLERQTEISLLNEQTNSKTQQRNMTLVIALLIVVIIAFNFFTYRQRQQLKLLQQKEAAQTQMQNMRDKIARDLHDDIGSNLSKISLMSEVVKKYPNAEESQPNLDRIANTARETLGQMNEIVWTMTQKNDSLKNLLSYLRHYAAEYFDNTDIDCKVIYTSEIAKVEISGDQRRNIFLGFKEALHNIVKHSKASVVTVSFNQQTDNLMIAVHDNGRGMELNKEKMTGNGLLNMEQRMKSINGSFSIENKVGTTITFQIPVEA